MTKPDYPVTSAVRMLREHRVDFTHHPYAYEERGGTAVSARELGVSEHAVIKTLVMEDDARKPLIVLMHGDREVSTKALARIVGVKTIVPCAPAVADRHSGYQVGGTSPFGTRRAMPVYAQRTIAGLPRVYVNGGKRGYLVGMAPADLVRVLAALVDIAQAGTTEDDGARPTLAACSARRRGDPRRVPCRRAPDRISPGGARRGGRHGRRRHCRTGAAMGRGRARGAEGAAPASNRSCTSTACRRRKACCSCASPRRCCASPMRDTADRLIRDKIARGDWDAASRRVRFAARQRLDLGPDAHRPAGRASTQDERARSDGLVRAHRRARRRARGARSRSSRRCASWPSSSSWAARSTRRSRAAARASNARYRYSFDMLGEAALTARRRASATSPPTPTRSPRSARARPSRDVPVFARPASRSSCRRCIRATSSRSASACWPSSCPRSSALARARARRSASA